MAQSNKRRLVVMASLIGVLTLTATLLLAIAPPPLSAEQVASLSNAAETTPVAAGRWTDVLLCGSPVNAAGGLENSAHFLLVHESNGLALRPTALWTAQISAPPPAGVASVNPRCVVVAVPPGIVPAVANEAVAVLRTRLAISPQRVWSITR
jgi:hypothetical protein